MSGISIGPNDAPLQQIDTLAEASADATRTPSALNEPELSAVPADARDTLREVALRGERGERDNAFLGQLRDSLSPGAMHGGALGAARGLTARPGLVSRTWQGVRDLFLSLIGRGDQIDSWWQDSDAIVAADRSGIAPQLAPIVRALSPSQHAAIQSPGFAAQLTETLEADPEYAALNREAERDATMIHEVLREQVRALAANAPQPSPVNARSPAEASDAGPARPGGTTHDLVALPDFVTEEPLFENSSENWRMWYRDGWGTVDDRERRVFLELAAGRPDGLPSVDGDPAAELNDENWRRLFVHTADALRQNGYESFEQFFRDVQRELGFEGDDIDAKPGRATFEAFVAWVRDTQDSEAFWNYNFIDVLQ